MRTVVVGERPAELQALLDRRRALGIDRFDEVWEGEYHVVPGPNASHGLVNWRLTRALDPLAEAVGLVGTIGINIGVADNFRVPDQAYHRGEPSGTWLPTAAIVVEILSEHDETWLKFDFYAAHEVDEICVAEPRARSIAWFRRDGGRYLNVEHSELLGVTVAELTASLAWPA